MSERKTALDVVMGNETLQKKMITEFKYMAIKIIHYKTLRKCTKKVNRELISCGAISSNVKYR